MNYAKNINPIMPAANMRSFSKNPNPPSEINDHALLKQMREVESLIEESKKVIDDEEEDDDLSSDDDSDGENHVKMLNAGDRGTVVQQILPDN